MTYRQSRVINQSMPVKQWDGGFTTQYSPMEKTHRISKDGKPYGYAFNALDWWAFILYDQGERHFNSLPEGMEALAHEA